MALRDVRRPVGTVVSFAADGDGGGSWHVIRRAGWELDAATPPQRQASAVRAAVDSAIKLDASAPPVSWRGDRELAEAIAKVKEVLG